MNKKTIIRWLLFSLFGFVTLLLFTPQTNAEERNAGTTQPKWTYDLFNKSTTGAGCSDPKRDCHFASPVLHDINQDGFLDVVVATSGGHVMVVRHNGTLLWSKDTATIAGRPANSMEIIANPAVADIDNDGKPEIVVATGHSRTNCSTAPSYGKVIVFEHNGAVKPGWPKSGQFDQQSGCVDGFGGAPTLGNLDNDLQLEVVIGGFDKRIYAWNHDGTALPNFPIDSYHAQRFNWPVLKERMADTIWSSASIADLNLDGENEIFIGTDEGMFDTGWYGIPTEWAGWDCDYVPPSNDWPIPPRDPGKYCGGSLYGVNRDGSFFPNFPRYYKETVASSPVVADVNSDGKMEMFVGQGTYYNRESPSHPTYAFYIYGLDDHGNDLPGWAGGKRLDGPVRAIPALGDITGDGKLEIVISTMNSSIYAFHANGSLVAGFPTKPKRHHPDLVNAEFARSVVLGDYDGDGKDEIFINNGWEVTILDGNSVGDDGKAKLLTGKNFPGHTSPIYLTSGSLINSPVIGDIDNDGELELIVQNSKLYVFDLVGSSDMATWPMTQLNSARTGFIQPASFLGASAENILVLHDRANSQAAEWDFLVSNSGTETLSWTTSVSSNNLVLTPRNGQIVGTGETEVDLSVRRSALNIGANNYTINLQGTANGETAPGSPRTIHVKVVVGDIHSVYMPMIKR